MGPEIARLCGGPAVVILNGKKVATVARQGVTMNALVGKVSLTDALGGTSNVTATDVQASNDVIDTVLDA